MRISDWSSDVCSSDLLADAPSARQGCDRVNSDGAIVEAAFAAQRGAHQQERAQLAARLDQLQQPGLHIVEQGALEKKVVERIAGQAELEEDHQRQRLIVAGAGELERRLWSGRAPVYTSTNNGQR